jgi:hypothetical protein
VTLAVPNYWRRSGPKCCFAILKNSFDEIIGEAIDRAEPIDAPLV